MTLIDQVRAALADAIAAYEGSPAARALDAARSRLDEPLRVALAGKVKAGKSTLLNALLGEELAPTDAGECTRIVTWYQDGPTYQVMVEPVGEDPRPTQYTRDAGAIEISLDGVDAAKVHRLIVQWPLAALRHTTLIDTPGIESLSMDVSARAKAFLSPEDDQPTAADAVLYLMRHLHAGDVRFLETFHDDDMARATPVNAIGVLSRADEIGVARLDAMESARRIAERYRRDTNVRALCQTVVPVAGLLAQAGSTLRQEEFRALGILAALPAEDRNAALLSVDRLRSERLRIGLTPEERDHLLLRFGLFGIRLSTQLLSDGVAASAPQLAEHLVGASGLPELRAVLNTQFTERRDVLKARAGLLALEAAFRDHPHPRGEELAAQVERIEAGAHEFTEVRLLNALRTRDVGFDADEVAEAERLLGAQGSSPSARLGASGGGGDDLLALARDRQASWQAKAESPFSSKETADACRVLVRTCEGLVAALS
ncbi:MAG TPA: dynamin family protein [Acidimicrobiia bacterium]|nr:dynamin family protein [Acidimicrobiia bacterium]